VISTLQATSSNHHRLRVSAHSESPHSLCFTDYSTFSKDRDGFEQKLTNLLANHLGKEIVPFVIITFVALDGKDVGWVRVQPSYKPVYVEQGDLQEPSKNIVPGLLNQRVEDWKKSERLSVLSCLATPRKSSATGCPRSNTKKSCCGTRLFRNIGACSQPQRSSSSVKIT
jgi:hypothetical protein